jgi:hypothetical protein
MANLRATATRARFGPRRFIKLEAPALERRWRRKDEALWPPWQCVGAPLPADRRHLIRVRAMRPADPDYVIEWCFQSGTCQGNLGLKENGQHRKRNRAAAIAMEAAIEQRTPFWVLKQPHFRGV